VVGSLGWEKICRTSNFEEISGLILAATIPLKLKMVFEYDKPKFYDKPDLLELLSGLEVKMFKLCIRTSTIPSLGLRLDNASERYWTI